MYTGTYEDEQTEAKAPQLDTQDGDPNSANHLDAPPSPDHKPPMLWSSVRVYALAGKYSVIPLQDLARKRFNKWLQSNWRNDELPALAKEVFDTTPSRDLGLRDDLATMLSDHSTELLQQVAWADTLETYAQMSYMVATKLSQKVSYHQNLETQLAKRTARSLGEKLDDCRRCRHCTMAFNVFIDPVEPETLRCRACRTRH